MPDQQSGDGASARARCAACAPRASGPDPAAWRLRVDGLVGQPLDLDLGDLAAMPQQLMVDDFSCLEGWTVPGLRWRGVAVAELLDRAAVPPEAAWVQLSADDFSLPLPIEEARTARCSPSR